MVGYLFVILFDVKGGGGVESAEKQNIKFAHLRAYKTKLLFLVHSGLGLLILMLYWPEMAIT